MSQHIAPPTPDTGGLPAVTRSDIVKALRRAGIKPGQILLIHSSLKSFGYVSGGPLTVIQAAREAVSPAGIVVFPTLVQRDFPRAYENWDPVDSPSDVGLITETFRLLPDTLRSDQATHSVAAWGRQAEELTAGHTAYGPRMGVFGDYCFSWSSPWQKIYLYDAKICFMGVGTHCNTFKHFVEYSLVETLCQQIEDPRIRCRAMASVRCFQTDGVWPFIDSEKTDALMKKQGLFHYVTCGQAVFTCFSAADFYNTVFPQVLHHPEDWFDADFMAWHQQYILTAQKTD